jgi:hypothetical protein
MKKSLLIIAAFALAMAGHAKATLLAGWDFQTTTNGGTAAAAAPGSPLVYSANFGTGTLYLNGTNGSSTWTSLASNPQVTSFGGTTVNTSGTSFSTTTSGASALTIANSSANGFAMTFSFSMAGFTDLTVSYASQRTATGFTGNQWAWSTDGLNFTNFGSSIVPASSYAAITLPTLNTLDGDSTVWLRYTVTGATSTSGNNRIDNIQFNAIAAIPEPHEYGIALAGLLGVAIVLRRRRLA